MRTKCDKKRVGFVDGNAYQKDYTRVRFLDMTYSKGVASHLLEDYDPVLPEIKQAMIDDSLDAKAKDWFEYLTKVVDEH